MIEFKEGRFFIGIWFFGFEDKDIMSAIWTDEDHTKPCIWELGYRFRYYDPEDPQNDAWSGKDRKRFYGGKSVHPETVDQCFEKMQKMMDSLRAVMQPEKYSFVPIYSDDPMKGAELLTKQPWAHAKQMTKEEYEKEYGKTEEKES